MAAREPVCGYTFRDVTCTQRGDHRCEPRADKVVRFFSEILVHTKGVHARTPFVLSEWQERDIIRPLFGNVRWNPEHQLYSRTFAVGYIFIGRKNGKSELLAGIALYMLAFDGEESAEVYGCARDRDQARIVFDVAKRMVELSPALTRKLKIVASQKRILHVPTNSVYQVLAADAAGNLGANPHLVIVDELLAQRDGELYEAMKTAMGSRLQALMLSATTAGNDPNSFASREHKQFRRTADKPGRAPHVFTFIREAPLDADPFDETVWGAANPALDDFLSREVLRQEALDAKNDPTKLASFKQYRLNQIVQATSRWMPLPLYEASYGNQWFGPTADDENLKGRVCYGGLDLSAKFDLTSWCLAFPNEDGTVELRWRHWMPEAAFDEWNKLLGGTADEWRARGWLTVTEGDVIDFDKVYEAIVEDAGRFAIRDVSHDPWSAAPAIQEIQRRTSIEFVSVQQTFQGLSGAMDEVMALTKRKALHHHQDPVALYCFDNVEVKRLSGNSDLIKPVKPERDKGAARVDAVITAVLAINGLSLRQAKDNEREEKRANRKPRRAYGF